MLMGGAAPRAYGGSPKTGITLDEACTHKTRDGSFWGAGSTGRRKPQACKISLLEFNCKVSRGGSFS